MKKKNEKKENIPSGDSIKSVMSQTVYDIVDDLLKLRDTHGLCPHQALEILQGAMVHIIAEINNEGACYFEILCQHNTNMYNMLKYLLEMQDKNQ